MTDFSVTFPSVARHFSLKRRYLEFFKVKIHCFKLASWYEYTFGKEFAALFKKLRCPALQTGGIGDFLRIGGAENAENGSGAFAERIVYTEILKLYNVGVRWQHILELRIQKPERMVSVS